MEILLKEYDLLDVKYTIWMSLYQPLFPLRANGRIMLGAELWALCSQSCFTDKINVREQVSVILQGAPGSRGGCGSQEPGFFQSDSNQRQGLEAFPPPCIQPQVTQEILTCPVPPHSSCFRCCLWVRPVPNHNDTRIKHAFPTAFVSQGNKSLFYYGTF